MHILLCVFNLVNQGCWGETAACMRRGSLEIGDMLLDVSAAPMEMTLLGTQGKVRTALPET